MTHDKKAPGTCPECSHELPISKSVFSQSFRCEHCGAALKISPLYTRLIVLLSVLLGYGLAWKIGIGSFQIFFWGVTWVFLML